MTSAKPIDREAEFALFDSMLKEEIEERILLIEAGSGWGKSILLREFARRRPQNCKFAKIDFKIRGISLAELLSRLCDKLEWKHFSTLRSELQSITRPSLSVGRNTLIGQNQIQ